MENKYRYAIFIAISPHRAIPPIYDDKYISDCIALEKAGFIAFSPIHPPSLNLITQAEYRQYFIIHADAVLRCSLDDSKDADNEVEYAKRYDIPAFDNVDALISYFGEQKDNYPFTPKFRTKSKQQETREQFELFKM